MNRANSIMICITLIISSLIFGNSIIEALKDKDKVRVIGSSSLEYASDIMKWQITLGTISNEQTLRQTNLILSQNIEKIKELIKSKPKLKCEISISSPFSYPLYDQSGQIKQYNIEQQMSIIVRDSSMFSLVEDQFNKEILNDPKLLIRNSQFQYYISKLAEVKHNIISEATKDAEKRANEVAKSSGRKVKKLLNAKVGIFQITEPFSTDIQSYGIYNTNTKMKQISVTVTSEFEIR
jgi:hypothetical protein